MQKDKNRPKKREREKTNLTIFKLIVILFFFNGQEWLFHILIDGWVNSLWTSDGSKSCWNSDVISEDEERYDLWTSDADQQQENWRFMEMSCCQ